LPVARAVPSFHRQNTEAIAHADAVHLDRLRQRRVSAGCQLIVEVQGNVVFQKMRAEGLRGLERRHARIGRWMRQRYASTPASGPVLSAKRSTGAPKASSIDM